MHVQVYVWAYISIYILYIFKWLLNKIISQWCGSLGNNFYTKYLLRRVPWLLPPLGSQILPLISWRRYIYLYIHTFQYKSGLEINFVRQHMDINILVCIYNKYVQYISMLDHSINHLKYPHMAWKKHMYICM